MNKWIYQQSTGQTWCNGIRAAVGYSGKGQGKNNPEMEVTPSVGPIPRGTYRMGAPRWSNQTGPHVIDLEPIGHNAHGRTALQVHGDSIKTPGTASRGCIILPRSIRDKMVMGDTIEVIE